METDDLVNEGFWETFLEKHHVDLDEEDAFVEYLTDTDVSPIRSLAELERVYAAFLRTQQGDDDNGKSHN